MSTAVLSKTEKIRALNDAFRNTFRGGRVMLTHGISTLPDMVKADVLKKIATFSDFNEDNDPHGEHDFVSVEVCGRTYYGKLDYYAPDMEHGSEDPSDTAKTVRVLTIMESSEY